METQRTTDLGEMIEAAHNSPNSLAQKEAVFQFVTEALQGTEVTVAQLKDKTVKTPEKKAVLKQVRVSIFNGIKAGTIAFAPNKTDGELKKYCSSLINNWLKKDKRFS